MRWIIGVAIGLACTVLSAQQAPAQTAHDLLQQALVKEQAEGDLRGAIALYERIVAEFSTERPVAAKALVQMGLCYEKLGTGEAERAYTRVVREYPDQTDMAEAARTRLTALERLRSSIAPPGPRFRQVRIPTRPENGVLSPSGDSLAFVSQGSLWVVPLSSDVGPDVPGEPVILAEDIGAWDVGNLLSWSADGKWIAVNGDGGDPMDPSFVHVVAADGSRSRIVEVLPRGGGAWSYRISLSPDGESLVFTAPEMGSTEDPGVVERYVYRAAVDGGEPVRIAEGWGQTPAVSPDGDFVAFVRPREREQWPTDDSRGRFDQDLWIAPTAGGAAVRLATVDGRLVGPVWSPDGRFIAARHQPGRDSTCREIWVYPLSSDRSSASEPFKIPLPRESWDIVAGWTPQGELGIFLTSEAHDAVYTVPSTGGKAVQVTPKAGYPAYPRWAADGSRIYFRTWRGEVPTVPVGVGFVPASGGEITELETGAERPLVSVVPGGGLNVSPDGGSLVMSAYQHPWLDQEGVDLWVVPIDGSAPTRLTQDASFEAYPIWTPDGAWVVFLDEATDDVSGEGEGYAALFKVPVGGGEAERLTSRSDSVAQGPIAASPDGLRIGFLSGGAIKTIPVMGGSADVLVEDVLAGRHDDLQWSPDGSRIAFSGEGKIWIAPGDGSGPPFALETGLPPGARHGFFSWSPDGGRIAFQGTIGGEDELWLISGFLEGRGAR